MYTPQQAATVFSAIRKQLLTRPDVFKREGIFRISGEHENSLKIINSILTCDKSKPFINAMSDELFPAYDHISALKIVLDDKESSLLDPNSQDIAQLRNIIESNDDKTAAYELERFIHHLIMSENENQHAVGEVLYTYLQLARNALDHEHVNKMNAINLGIVLGPNFEKLINSDPYKMLPLIHKLNNIATILLMSDTYKEDFAHKYVRHILQMKNSQLAELKHQQTTLQQMSAFYQDKIDAYQEKLASEKSQANTADRKHRKLLRAQIISDEKTISSYQIVSQDSPTDKLAFIQMQIDDLQREIVELKQQYPDCLKSSLEARFERLSIITHEIDELISDDEEPLDSPLRMSKNLLMVPQTELSLAPKLRRKPVNCEYSKPMRLE